MVSTLPTKLKQRPPLGYHLSKMRRLLYMLILLVVAIGSPFSLIADSKEEYPIVDMNEYSTLAESYYAAGDTTSLKDLLIEEIAKSIGQYANGTPQKLPLGIAKRVNGAVYAIALDKMRFTPQGAFIGAFASVEIPGTNHPIAFAASDVSVGIGGISAKQTKLALISEHTIKLSQNVSMTLAKDGGNYIEWDCNGFKSINLKGFIEFSTSLMVTAETQDVPYADGERPPQGKVKASFEVHAESLHDLIFYANMPAFKPKAGGVIFEASKLMVDLSDLSNPNGIIFPPNYQTGLEEAEKKLWRGFYAEKLSVTLPKELSDSTAKPLSIEVRNLIIDDMGVTVNARAENLLGKANADGWPFTIDEVKISILKNQLTGGGLNGLLKIPMLGFDTLRYTAEVYEREQGWDYAFTIETGSDRIFSMDALSAKLKIDKGSYVTLEKKEGKFTASALLNGKLDIETNILGIKDVKFEKLSLLSRAPYLTDGIIDVVSDKANKVGSFPIALDKFKLEVNEGNPKLYVGVSVNFMDEKSFSGSTAVILYSKMNEEKGYASWKVHKVEVETVKIACNLGAFGLNGEINFYREDPIFGDGFGGKLKMQLTELLKDIEAEANFGKKDDFRYWRASLQVPIKIPIPPVPSLFINTLKGGMAYRMMRESAKPEFIQAGEASKPDRYVPDKESGISFLAGVGLTFGEAVVAAKLQFEVAFLQSGGLRYVAFDGDAAFLTPPDELMSKLKSVDITQENNPPKSAVSIRMNMLFNNEAKSFHANMKTYVNLLGIVKGTGPNNLVGESVIHFDPSDWYIYIGRPSQPNGLSVLGLVETKSYFMMGTKVENMPEPPPQVTSVLTKIKADFMQTENSMSTGKGFGMGMRFDMNFGFGQDKGFVYAFINVGAGSDILLRSYGDAQCQGQTGTIGFDGWYASGQAYAYLAGGLGIRVKKKKFDILSVQMAAILQAKAFNPSWFSGAIGAKYSVLGGLIKGNVELKVILGKECVLVTNGDELGIKIINDIQPVQGQNDVSVFTAPQVSFNTAIGEQFGMMNLSNQYEQYRVQLDELTLAGAQGAVNGEITWNTDKNVAVISSSDVLPGKEDLKVSVKIHIEKKVGTEAWQPFMDNGKVDYESKESAFKTGEAPDYIPHSNVLYAYPINNQYNFYPKEYGKGYIKLKKGQPYLFANPDGEAEFKVAFTSPDKKTIEAPVGSYDNAQMLVNFDIPEGFRKETVYSMSIIRKSKNAGGGIDRNLEKSTTTVETGNSGSVAEVAQNKLAGSITSNIEKQLYTINLRSSAYATFVEKMNAMTGYQELQNISSQLLWVFGARLNTLESFDRFELAGEGGSFEPLVAAQAVAEGKWYKSFVLPVLYDKYAQGDATITTSRNINQYGLIPLKAVLVYNEASEGYQLQNQHVTSGFAPVMQGRIYIENRVSSPVFSDFMELRSKAANKYIDSGLGAAPENARRLLECTGYVDVQSDTYKVNLGYMLPGINKLTSSKQYNIKF